MAILMSSLAELKSRGFARLRPILPLRSLPSAERRDPHIAAASLRTKASQHVVAAGSRLWRALPAVLIGILLNTLDAVSTGLLVFPTGAPFSSLQVQAMSLYLMSTITSQLTMTLGGSRFPGALGSMLIEILPFLRDIASAIQGTLGNDSPSLLPTVFAAYAMTSLLIGVVFFVLGALKCGRLVEYFPKTVLTGAIGAIGLSLFLLALELPLPPSAPPLSLSTAREVLFNRSHIALLFASLLPAVFLSISIRIQWLAKVTRNFTEHALYVPVYIFVITGVFWAVVGGQGLANVSGMESLASQGWLFTVDDSVWHQEGVGMSWNYWSQFNFSLVKWSAMAAAIQDIVLLVIIGVLNLPIYVPALALALDEPSYHMNHEFLGHSASNLLAGVVGTVPNLVVMSNSLFFTQAGGGRFEAMIVTALTVVLFFVSSCILPYVPTILASTLVLFLGIELMTEAMWSSAKSLLWCEWTVVMGTLLACTFVGFAPGFGIGIALALIMHLGWNIFDLQAKAYELILPVKRDESGTSEKTNGRDSTGPGTTQSHDNEKALRFEPDVQSVQSSVLERKVTTIRLAGYVFFAIIPSTERQWKSATAGERPCQIILDFNNAHRIETSVAEFLARKIRETVASPKEVAITVAGVPQDSGIHADLQRGGVVLRWDSPRAEEGAGEENGVRAFATLEEAVHQAEASCVAEQLDSDADVLAAFRALFPEKFRHQLLQPFQSSGEPLVDVMRNNGITIRRLDAFEILADKSRPLTTLVFLVNGKLLVEDPDLATQPVVRRSLKDTLSAAYRKLVAIGATLWQRTGSISSSAGTSTRLLPRCASTLLPGAAFGFADCMNGSPMAQRIAASNGPCWLLEVAPSNEKGMAWALKVLPILQQARKKRQRRMLSFS